MGWRCLFCGEIVDELILENRRWFKTGIVPINKESRFGIAQRSMNKANLIKQVSEKTNIDLKAAKAIVDTFFDAMSEESGER